MVIVTHNLGLRLDDKLSNGFIRLYGRRAKTHHVIYGWAACECTCQAYVQDNGRPYMYGANQKVAGLATDRQLDGLDCAGDHVLCSCSGGVRK